jgi:hypothetical protein
MQTRMKRWLIVLVLIVDGVGLTAFGWSRMSTFQELAERGVEVRGKVLDHSSEHHSKRSTSYRLTVEFSPTNAATATKTLTVDGDTYRAAVKQGTVTVRYLPEDPDTCSSENVSLVPYQIVKVFGMVMLGAGLIVGWLAFRPRL